MLKAAPYVPAGTPVSENVPPGPVVVDWKFESPGLVAMTTQIPGTGVPDSSVTTPETEPVACAAAGAETMTARTTAISVNRKPDDDLTRTLRSSMTTMHAHRL